MRMRLFGALLTLLLFGWFPTRSPADIQCDGVDDVLLTGLALSTFIQADQGTMMLWVKVGTGGGSGTFCWDGKVYAGDGQQVWALGEQASLQVCGFLYDAAAANHVHTAAATTGTWTHLALRLGGGQVSFWRDGVQVSTQAAGNVFSLAGLLSVCAYPDGSGGAAATITEVALYNLAVPDGELATLGRSRQRGLGRSAPSGYWPLTRCVDGQGLDGAGFVDHSWHGRTLVADNGANNTGMVCRASAALRHPWGPH